MNSSIRTCSLAIVTPIRTIQVVSRLVHLLGTRILGTLKGDSASQLPVSNSGPSTPKVTNLATVAIIAISDDVPIVAFAKELEKHLNIIGETLSILSIYLCLYVCHLVKLTLSTI